jgi:Fur family zinc uptake transcriptional regulator
MSGDLAAIQAVLNAQDNLDKLAGYPDEALLAALSSPDSEITVLETADGGLAAFLWLTWLTSTRGVKIEEFGAAEPGLGHGGRLFDAVLEDVIARYPDRSVWLAVAPPTVYRALKGLEEAGFVHRIESLRAWAAVSSPAPGVVAICDDCGSVRSVEAPSLFESLHHRLAAEGFADARQTIEVHGRCGDCAEGKA